MYVNTPIQNRKLLVKKLTELEGLNEEYKKALVRWVEDDTYTLDDYPQLKIFIDLPPVIKALLYDRSVEKDNNLSMREKAGAYSELHLFKQETGATDIFYVNHCMLENFEQLADKALSDLNKPPIWKNKRILFGFCLLLYKYKIMVYHSHDNLKTMDEEKIKKAIMRYFIRKYKLTPDLQQYYRKKNKLEDEAEKLFPFIRQTCERENRLNNLPDL